MKKLSHLFLLFFIILSISACKQNKEITEGNYFIEIRNFNFKNNDLNKYTQQVKTLKTDYYRLFIYYKSALAKDTLKILKNNQVYYNNILLEKIDFKNSNIKKHNLSINKFFYKSKISYKGDCYLFIDLNKGLIFKESLNSGLMTEYDTQKIYSIHKKIALRQLGFKNGKFELQYASMNYPELNMMDSIKEDKKWRYFIKKEN